MKMYALKSIYGNPVGPMSLEDAEATRRRLPKLYPVPPYEVTVLSAGESIPYETGYAYACGYRD